MWEWNADRSCDARFRQSRNRPFRRGERRSENETTRSSALSPTLSLFGRLEMRQSRFGMSDGRCNSAPAVRPLCSPDRPSQMGDATLDMPIGFLLLGRPGMFDRNDGMFDKRRRVPLLSFVDSFLRFLDRLCEMFRRLRSRGRDDASQT